MIKRENRAKPLKINLLASKSFEASPLGKIINWSLTIGKSIVFITFSIVIFTLFYRFSLDRKIEALNDKINQNLTTIQSYSQMETQLKKAQNKISLIKSIDKKDQKYQKIFQKIEANLAPSSTISKLTISQESQVISLTGFTQNEMIFSQMINGLKRQEEFTEISIDEMKSGGIANPKIDFVINIQFNQIK